MSGRPVWGLLAWGSRPVWRRRWGLRPAWGLLVWGLRPVAGLGFEACGAYRGGVGHCVHGGDRAAGVAHVVVLLQEEDGGVIRRASRRPLRAHRLAVRLRDVLRREEQAERRTRLRHLVRVRVMVSKEAGVTLPLLCVGWEALLVLQLCDACLLTNRSPNRNRNRNRNPNQHSGGTMASSSSSRPNTSVNSQSPGTPSRRMKGLSTSGFDSSGSQDILVGVRGVRVSWSAQVWLEG